jgi:hypothetical protein
LGADERAQIAGAAERVGLSLGAFIRQASLVSSARVEGRVVVREKLAPEKAVAGEEWEREPRGSDLFGEPEPTVHIVDGEPVNRAR